jgi:glycosyltransferase involved in cell wall biosynthesis
LKILFYSSKSTYSGKSFGGAERSMTVMAEAMANMGHDVHFLSGRDNLRFARAQRTLENGVEIHFLPVFKFFFLRFDLFRKFSEFIRRRIFQNYLSKEFHDFDMVYVYNEYPGLYQIVQWRIRSGSGIKIVYRVAGLYLFDNVLKFHPKLKSRIFEMFQAVDVVNFISLGVKELYLEQQRKKNIEFSFKNELVLDIGIPDLKSKEKWRLGDKEKFTCVMVARFAIVKGHDVLLEAFRKWNNRNARLVLLGDGPLLNEFKKEYSLNGSGAIIDFKGFVDSEEVDFHLLNSNVFCLCTYGEALSKSVVEAMGIGVPILVSDVMALNSYITNNENGVLVDNTVEAWVSALDKMYNTSKEELEALSKREIAYAKEHFDVEVNAKKYIVAFESLVQS